MLDDTSRDFGPRPPARDLPRRWTVRRSPWPALLLLLGMGCLAALQGMSPAPPGPETAFELYGP